jgi:hypothetical protein
MLPASFGRWFAWIALVLVVLLCVEGMLTLLHPPAGDNVALAQLALATPESGGCAAWDNVAIEADQTSRTQLRALQREACPDRPWSDPEQDGN